MIRYDELGLVVLVPSHTEKQLGGMALFVSEADPESFDDEDVDDDVYEYGLEDPS